MIIRFALFLLLAAFALSFIGSGKARTWMGKLALAGFCLLLLVFFLRLLSRML